MEQTHREGIAEYRDYLNQLAKRVENPSEGFFGPQSIAWRINREGVLGLGALRALFMQIAHPAVARGIAEHSRYKTKPFSRVYNTLQSQQMIVFGSVEQATEALMRMYARHAVVRGDGSEKAHGYSGNDPLLQLWVLGTLIDTIMRGHADFLQPLREDERAAFYGESKWLARLLGIPAEILPEDLSDFEDWMDAMLGSAQLEVTPQARDIAHSLLRLPLPIFWPSNYLLVAGMLPASIRDGFGLRWTGAMESIYRLGVGAVRKAANAAPLRWRTSPMYWRALARVSEKT
jgi:uncharacterized protein (DUF2236 family)